MRDSLASEGKETGLRAGLGSSEDGRRVLVEGPSHAKGAVVALEVEVPPSESKHLPRPQPRLPEGTEKRGVEVTFRESTEGRIRCLECASQSTQA
jgi:hypothetical protein